MMNAENRIRMRYVVADLLSTALAVLLFNIYRYFDLPSAYSSFNTLGQFLRSPMVLAGQLLFPPAMLLVYYLSGIYSRVYMRSRVSELLTTISTAVIGTLVIIFVALINDLTLERYHDYSMFLMALGLLTVIVYIPRLLLTCRMQSRIRRGDVAFNTLIVGYGSHPELFTEQLNRLIPNLGLRPVGFVDAENILSSDAVPPLPMSAINEITDTINRLNVSRIMVIPNPGSWERTVGIVSSLIPHDLPILIPAESLPSFMFSASIVNLKSDPYIDISSSRQRASTMNLKRALDVVVSALVIVVTFIPGLLAALAIKIDSRGPVFYTQTRVGHHRRLFTIIKLRTMHVDSEADGVARLSRSGDPRVTRVGRILRRYRIDEFPQFINVLLGDMSIVGPRPERPQFVDEILRREPAYTFVFSVRPGITSLGMVKYGYASTLDQIMRRTRYDMLYIEHLSIINDLKIILHTINTVVSGKGV